MAQKLPVGEILNEAFQFGVQRWGAVVRFAWLPSLIVILISAGAAMAVIDYETWQLLEAEDAEFSSLDGLFRVSGLSVAMVFAAVMALIMLLFAGPMASIYRLVALGEDRPGYFHLRFDGPAIRVFWALIIFSLIGLVINVLAFFLALSMTGQSVQSVFGALGQFWAMLIAAESEGRQIDPSELQALIAPAQVFGLTMFFSSIVSLFVNVRLMPFIAGTAAEDRVLLLGSLRLTRGHFGSILLTLVLLFLVMLVIGVAAQIVFSILDLLTNLMAQIGGVALIGGTILGLIYFGLTIFYQAYIFAVQWATQAIIYRRLKTGA